MAGIFLICTLITFHRIMTLIDTHTHLYLPEFDHDRNEAVERALAAGIEKMFLPNIDTSSITPMLKLAEQFPSHCYPMMGIHPSSLKDDWDKEIGEAAAWLERHPFIAVGEIGIDLYWEKRYRLEQMEGFARQIQMALDHDLPVVIHSRESLAEIFDVLKDFSSLPPGVFHSFTGTRKEAEQILDMGFFLGIGGIVTFKNSALREEIRPLGPERIVLETDAPFLAPVPQRGRRNESSFLVHTAAFLAELFGISVDELARITTRNARTLFPKAFE